MAKKGEILSKEYREKISKGVKNQHIRSGHLGNHCPICGIKIRNYAKRCKKHRLFTNEHRKKLSIANTGKKQSKETLEKLSEIRKGKIPWNKNKKVPQISGEKHWRWKGGNDRELLRLRNSFEYNSWRGKILERDNYTCKICSNHGGKLNVHHIELFSECKEKRFDINNGITLCEKCHKFLHRDDHLDFLYDGPINTFKKCLNII
jgi:5-methylcytosine-specific restriction endonuclease McrA